MENETQQISDKVRGVAAEKRFSQQRIATALSVSRTTVADRFAGRTPYTGPELLTLSREFGVPITRFFPEAGA